MSDLFCLRRFGFAASLLAPVVLAFLLVATGCRPSVRGSSPAAPEEGHGQTSASLVVGGKIPADRSGSAPESAPSPPVPVASAETTASLASARLDSEESTAPHLLIIGSLRAPGRSAVTSASLILSRFPVVAPGHRGPIRAERVLATSATAEGRFEIRVEDAPQMSLGIDAPGYAQVSTSVGYGQFRDSSAGPERKLPLDLELMPAVTVRGRLVSDQGKPLPEVPISGMVAERPSGEPRTHAFGLLTTTTLDGSFELDRVPAGALILTARPDGHVPVVREVEAPAEGIELVAGTDGAGIEGAVFVKETGEAAEGATVTLRSAYLPDQDGKPNIQVLPRETSVRTDSTGGFRFSKLRPGSYQLDAIRAGLYSAPARRQGENVIALGERETTSAITLFLIPGLTLSGLVTEKGTERPVDGVEISAGWGPDAVVTSTTADGRYRLAGIRPTNGVSVRVEKDGWRVAQRPGSGYQSNFHLPVAPEEQHLTEDIELEALHTLRGRVVSETSAPLSGVRLGTDRVRGAFATESVVSGADGSFQFAVPPDVALVIHATARGYAPARSKTLEIGREAPDEVILTLSRGGTVSGVVLDPLGQAAPEAKVSAIYIQWQGNSGSHIPVGEVMSDGVGRFTLAGLPAEEIRLTAEKKGYASSQVEIVKAEALRDTPEVRLKLRTASFVAGRVTDEEGKPIEGATVSAQSKLPGDGARGRAKSDKEGHYRIEDLPEAPLRVNALADDHASAQLDSVDPGRDDVDFRLKSNGDRERQARARKEVPITGKVVDWRSGQPLTDFTVKSSGNHPIRKVAEAPGQFVVEGIAEGYSVSVSISAPECLTLENQSLRAGEEKVFAMGPGGGVTGRVVRGGVPAADIAVELRTRSSHYITDSEPPVAFTRTDADGRFTLERLAPGELTVKLLPEKKPFMVQRQVSVEHGKVEDLGDVALASGATIHVRAVRNPGGEPISEMELALRLFANNASESLGTRRSGTDGTAVFENVPPGRYSLSASAYDLKKWFDLEDGENKEVVMEIGASVLRGTVTWRGNAAPSNIQFLMSDKDGNIYAATEADGSFEVEGLPEGNLVATVSPVEEDGLRLRYKVDLAAGAVTEHDFELPDAAVTGKVLDGDDQPVPDVEITLRARDSSSGDWRHSQTKSWQDGTFQFKMVRAGEYSLEISGNNTGHISQSQKITVPAAGDFPVTIRLGGGGGTVVGALSSASGRPISAPSVRLHPEGGAATEMKRVEGASEWQLTDVPPGKYWLNVQADYFVSVRKPVEVKEEETARVEVRLEDAGGLRWTIVGKDGSPLQSVSGTVTLESGGGREYRHPHLQEGVLEYRNLAPGPYIATVEVPQQGKATEAFTIYAGKTATLRSRLE